MNNDNTDTTAAEAFEAGMKRIDALLAAMLDKLDARFDAMLDTLEDA